MGHLEELLKLHIERLDKVIEDLRDLGRDHEIRLRELERSKERARGAIAGYAAIGGVIAALASLIANYFLGKL